MADYTKMWWKVLRTKDGTGLVIDRSDDVTMMNIFLPSTALSALACRRPWLIPDWSTTMANLVIDAKSWKKYLTKAGESMR